jgi:transcriptional regulator GlxA family with amidase domain
VVDSAAGPGRHVGILVFDEAEVLDVAGPFEVFSVAGRRDELDPFRVSLIAERAGPVRMRNGFVVQPHFTIADAPTIDLLLIPGGYGTRRELHNAGLIEWIRTTAVRAELVLSVCTGSLLLGKAGLLDGLGAVTHHGAVGLLREIAPTARLLPRERFVDNGRIVTSAGVSAGIDMSLHVVGRLLGTELAQEAAQYMEYHWDSNAVDLADEGI